MLTADTGDIQAVAAGVEELLASVGEISQQVSTAARMAGEAVEQARRTGAIVAGLSGDRTARTQGALSPTDHQADGVQACDRGL